MKFMHILALLAIVTGVIAIEAVTTSKTSSRKSRAQARTVAVEQKTPAVLAEDIDDLCIAAGYGATEGVDGVCQAVFAHGNAIKNVAPSADELAAFNQLCCNNSAADRSKPAYATLGCGK